MAVSSLEVALSDSLRYYLAQFPQKLDKNELKYSKEEFFENYFELIISTAEKYVLAQSRESFDKYFTKYMDLLALDINVIEKDLIENIQEINASRNLLLHNDLVVNDAYILSSGNKCRSTNKSNKLKVDLIYIRQSVDYIILLCDSIQNMLLQKYDAYTKVAANKRLWKFMFTSRVMPYEDFWKVDEKKDEIVCRLTGKYEESISSSEKSFLDLWRSHFNV
ncbi:MAG: hypothetical protein WCT99_07950 [Bacteroidota bacterium]